MTRIKLNNITQIIKLEIRLKQDTFFILQVGLSLLSEKASLLCRGFGITVIIRVDCISANIIRG